MREQKVIWFALVFSTFIYAVIIWTLAPNTQGTFSEAVQRHQFTLILYVLALATFVMANVRRRERASSSEAAAPA